MRVALFRRHALGAVAFLSRTRLSVRSEHLLIFKTAPPSSADFHRLRLVQLDVSQTELWRVSIFFSRREGENEGRELKAFFRRRVPSQRSRSTLRFSKPRTRSMLRSKRVCLGGHNAPWPSTNTSTTAGVCSRLSRIALLF